ncbi:LysR family transcriptional regulator [Pseudoalteromonas sp. SG43-6]|uniref:LysR family transcriptional regulator n=1 Tax=Pseudoalteromonas sp. SG43-6 TaxID=2760967 RepID=UPI0015FFECC1|nr:LysR family transcriptional regulator [Pseudoalteromonas sp. SG43-6]MBB1436884.1 LysR family transcriptional regulator [Pseudoalteromonas sp. SG43-6]
MDRLKAIEIFISVCKEKNFSKVATKFDISTTMVSKYVNFLEKEVNIKLLNRSTRGQNITEAGEVYLNKAKALQKQYRDLVLSMDDFTKEPEGLINVNAPHNFGTHVLTTIIADFLEANPAIRIDLTLSDSLTDVVLDNYDIVFRVGDLKDASYISKRVFSQQLIFCASPKYLKTNGPPKNITDLENHHFLGFKPWFDSSNFKKEFRIDLLHLQTSRFISNNGSALKNAALKGIGIILQPYHLLEESIQSGKLIRVLEGCQPKVRNVHLLYADKKQPLKVRKFIDFVSENLTN